MNPKINLQRIAKIAADPRLPDEDDEPPQRQPGPGQRFFRMHPEGGAEPIGEMPAGARRVHLYRVENVLRPRGPLRKESLSLTVLEKMVSAFQEWTDPEYGDSLEPSEAMDRIVENAREEVETAVQQFQLNPGEVDY